MNKFDGVIVVEGKSDEALLRTFLDAEIVKTNGSAVPRETINYLKNISKYRDIVVLTDPDFPGKRIRDRLDAEIPNLIHAFVPRERSIKHNKVGVAECDIDTIIDVLNHVEVSKKFSNGNLTTSDLYDLGLIGCEDSQEKRDLLEKKLYIGHTNGKTLLKRLNSLNINKNKIKEVLENEQR